MEVHDLCVSLQSHFTLQQRRGISPLGQNSPHSPQVMEVGQGSVPPRQLQP